MLRYYEDLTEAETARVLGISVGTVKSQARDALVRLRATDAVQRPDATCELERAGEGSGTDPQRTSRR